MWGLGCDGRRRNEGRGLKSVVGCGDDGRISCDEIQIRKGDDTYLFLFIALLAQVFASSGHLSAAHSVFFGSKVFFGLRFCTSEG